VRFKAFNIKYDTDGRKITTLPTVVEFDAESLEAAREDAADRISDVTGFLVESLDVRPLVTSEELLDQLLNSAKWHGQDSDPDHEVGDLQDDLREAVKFLTPDQVQELYVKLWDKELIKE
jgi:hypothetical protein